MITTCIDRLLKVVLIGPNWPAGGEIDIVEGINNYTNNQATIHTNVGCTLPSSSSTTLAISGSVVGGTDCAAYDTGNEGCGIRSSSNNSFGAGFNNNGGGVYASMLTECLAYLLILIIFFLVKWDTTGIAVYFFPRGSVPADISADAPKPHSWGYPQGRWPAPTCAPFQYFNHHSAIFDTTLWCAMLSDQSDVLILSFFVVVIGRELAGLPLVSRVKTKAVLR